MDAVSKAKAILDDLRIEQNVFMDIRKLNEIQNSIHIPADILPSDSTKFLFGQIDEGTELCYEREEQVDEELVSRFEKVSSINPVERARRQKERER